MKRLSKAPNAHTVRSVIEAAIAGDADGATDRVMDALNDLRIVTYRPQGQASLLTANGRVLMILLEYPEATLREISTMVGSTESAVSRSITGLVESRLVKRRKVRGRNRYEVDAGMLAEHADVARLYLALDSFLAD